MLRFVYQGFSTLAKANPLKNGFRFENQNLTWTFGEFDTHSSAFAYGLVEQGWKQGDKLLLLLGRSNTSEAAATFVGAAKAGVIAVPFRSNSSQEIENAIKTVNPKGIVFSPNQLVGDVKFIEVLKQLVPEAAQTQSGSSLKSGKFSNLKWLIHTGFYSYPGTYKFRESLVYASRNFNRLSLPTVTGPVAGTLKNGQLQQYTLSELAKLTDKVQGSKNVIVSGDPQTVTNFSIGIVWLVDQRKDIIQFLLVEISQENCQRFFLITKTIVQQLMIQCWLINRKQMLAIYKVFTLQAMSTRLKVYSTNRPFKFDQYYKIEKKQYLIMQIDSQQSLIQVKRERFRVQIRKEQLDQLLTKKRIVVPHQGNEILNEKLQKVRNQMIAITENMENEFTQAMNKYYDYLVEYDLMNDILHEFRVNYHPEGRIQIYWILSNLTLGDGISTKLLFDTSFDFLNVIYYDLKYQEYVFFGLEIIQNFLADRDIDVVEALLTDDSLLKVLNTQMIPEEKYNQIVTHLCHNIVQFKLFLSEYTVETICLAMPARIAFQWTYILAKGMENQNNHLILHTLKYLLQNNDDYNFILIKILEQVMEQELLKQIFQQKEIKYSIAQLFLNTHNPDIQNSILLIYEIVSSDDDLAQLICQTEVLDKAIELSLEQYTCVNALKFLDTWMGDFEFLFDYPKLIDEQFYCQQINNLNFEFPAESIQILKYIESILQYGDSRNDESYRLLLCKYKIQIENLAYSQNDVLEKLAEQILQCYVTD